ncbi:hypothetical protein L0U85_08755 [Glycomyces sp. L485]|uniref:hypothetical protein n=1 Tax=Glycomyces sp. L485 TaxID=2909235 RepID=UPI001F4B17F7|nr:hypothetical protein [Glycomyces sp. L485]MCH7230937.1 hypothetical protein [Glycomyces sp. L485]
MSGSSAHRSRGLAKTSSGSSHFVAGGCSDGRVDQFGAGGRAESEGGLDALEQFGAGWEITAKVRLRAASRATASTDMPLLASPRPTL